MPAATPLFVLRERLLEEQAAVAAAQQALAAATARVAAVTASRSLPRSRLEAIEAQIAAAKRQQADEERLAAEARARADRCGERRQQIAAFLKDLDPTPRDRQSGGLGDA